MTAAPAWDPDRVRSFCIGHRPPQFPLPPGTVFVTERPCGVDGAWIYPETYPQLMSGDSASEYPALFAIRRRLEAERFDGLVLLTQYRKFVSPLDVGRLTGEFPHVKLARPDEVAALPAATLLPRDGVPWLVSKPMECPRGLGRQYAKAHLGRDLLRFLADAVDLGGIDDAVAMNLLGATRLLVSPAVGVYPAGAFITVFAQLEAAASAFLAGGYRPRPDYQRRVVGYCLERLNSVLVGRHIIAAGLDGGRAYGFVTVVGDEERLTPTA